MFEKYGPNSLKVDAYIRAVAELSVEQLALVGRYNLDLQTLSGFGESLNTLGSERVREKANAYLDVAAALENSTAVEQQKTILSGLAAALVVEDRLSPDERRFLHLYLIAPTVPLKLLYDNYQKEDFAIEHFCEALFKIDGENAYLKTRPDERGQKGAGLPDFIINRAGKDYTVEHTLVNSFAGQAHYEVLFAKYFKPLNLEQKVQEVYPNDLIDIYIPQNAFTSESAAEKFDFDLFVRNVITAVGQTPVGYNGDQPRTYHFPNTPFAVDITNDGPSHPACFVVQVVPRTREQVAQELENDILRALNKKRKKLQEAKTAGADTILLLDSEDYALVNQFVLARAFGRVVAKCNVDLDGIDEVYILFRGGNSWVVPVKLGARTYPDLPEFRQYMEHQLGSSLR